jgi:hypothetical protein
LTVVSAEGNWADIAWSTPSNTGTQPLNGFALFASVDGGITWILSGTVLANQQTYRFGGLQSNTGYLFAAQALTNAGASELSNSATYVTAVFIPDAPTGLLLGGHGCGSDICGGEVAITPPTYGGVGTLSFDVGYSVDAGLTWTFVDAEILVAGSYTLQFMTGSLTFEQQNNLLITVRASTEFGMGPLSEPIGFQYILRSETTPGGTPLGDTPPL